MDKVGECRGDRGGNVYHVYDGYFYRINHNDTVRKYLACVKKSCPGRASMPSAMEDRIINNFRMTGLHNHRPNLHRIELSKLKQILISRSESELTPLKQIYDEEIAKVPEEVAEMLRYRVYRSTMQRVRKLVQNAIMNALQEEVDGADQSDMEYTEDPVSEDDAAEFTYLEDQPEMAVNAKRKRGSKESGVKKIKSSNRKNEMSFEAVYLEEEETEKCYGDEDFVEYDYEFIKEDNLKDEDVPYENGEVQYENGEVQYEDGEVRYKDEEVCYEAEEVHNKGENVYESVNEQYVDDEKVFDIVNESSEEMNHYSSFYVENEVEILTSELIIDSMKPTPETTSSPKKVKYLKTNSTEKISEDLQEYVKINEPKPEQQNNQYGDLLSTFFQEVEETVRSFLPSVIIEAKGKIASLVNRLEMRNWQVQQLLKEKEKELLKQKQLTEKQLTQQSTPQQVLLKQIQSNQHQPQSTQRPQQSKQPQQESTQSSQQQRKWAQQLLQHQSEKVPTQKPLQQQIQQEQTNQRLQLVQHQEQENHQSQVKQLQTFKLQRNKSTPVVIKFQPNMPNTISLRNTIPVSSLPLIKVRKISSLQDPNSKVS